MAGFFFVLTIWLQGGEGFSPLSAGLTALAFSAGTIVFAGMPQRLIRASVGVCWCWAPYC